MELGAALLTLSVSAGIKVIVMIFSAVMLVRMYKLTSARPSRKLWLNIPEKDLPQFKILYWSMISFGISELFCGVETYIIKSTTVYLRGIHGVSSALGMGLFALGMYMILDDRVIRYGEAGCVADRICRGCTLRQGKDCKFDGVILTVATLLLLATIPPLFVSTDPIIADPRRFILPFESLNNWYDTVFVPWQRSTFLSYRPLSCVIFMPTATQILEFKIFPGLAMAAILAGMILFRLKRRTLGMQAMAFGAGFLSYGYLELAMYRLTGDLFLGALGHEIAELLFLAILAGFLTNLYPAAAGKESRATPVGVGKAAEAAEGPA